MTWLILPAGLIVVSVIILVLLQQLSKQNGDPDAEHLVVTITMKPAFWRPLREWRYRILLAAQGRVFKKSGDYPPGTARQGVLWKSSLKVTREIEFRAYGFDPDEYERSKEVDAALEQLALAMDAKKVFIRRRT